MQTASGVLMKSKLHMMCRVPSSGVVPMDSGEQRSATPGTKAGLETETAQKDQFRTRIAMTAAVQLVEKQGNSLQTDTVELNALRCEIQ